MKNITEYVLHELLHNNTPEPVVSIFGDLNYDYIYNSPPLESGKEVIVTDFSKNLAGAGGIVACGFAKLGAEVFLITELGDDADGRSLYEEIAGFGVRQNGLKLMNNKKSPFTLIFTTEKEKRPRQVASFLGTSRDFSIDRVDYKDFVNKADLVYSCNYFLLQRLREEVRFVFRFARSVNVTTAYDANAGDGWENERTLQTLKTGIYPYTDIVFLNESESYYLTKINDPAKAIGQVSPGSLTVVVKLGSRGLIIRHWDKLYRFSAFPLRGKVQDTVGAGDSFQAAFLYFYMRKFPIELCGVLGAANAASTVQHKGGTSGQCDYNGLKYFVKNYRVYDRGGGDFSVEL
jgi:sugar/nucleoside kinase (ribokinase family)